MTTSLQKSSVSFRRQGSSGRVWDNLHIDTSKSGPLVGAGTISGPLVGTPTGKSGPLVLSPTGVCALQRSSVSFRRQGSSGRVWDNINIDETRSGPLFGGPAVGRTMRLVGTPTGTIEEERYQLRDKVKCREEGLQGRGEMKDVLLSSSCSSSSASSSRSNHHHRHDERCGLLSFFKSCMGPPPKAAL